MTCRNRNKGTQSLSIGRPPRLELSRAPPTDGDDSRVRSGGEARRAAAPRGGGVERPAPVEPGDQRHELRERAGPLQHERVDRDALARAALDLAQRFLDRPARGRVVELDLAMLEMGGWLPVRDDHDLAIA